MISQKVPRRSRFDANLVAGDVTGGGGKATGKTT